MPTPLAMLSVSLGLPYIVQYRKFERHKFSSKHLSCIRGCDLFPGASHLLPGAVSLLDLMKVVHGRDGGFSLLAQNPL